MKKYEFIEHTADVAVRVFGKDLPDLFCNAAQALLDLMLGFSPQSDIDKNVTIKALSYEDLLVDWLAELISLLFADQFVPATMKVSLSEEGSQKVLMAQLSGQAFNPYENKIKTEVKAATYHDLNIRQTEQGYEVVVVFDV